MMVRTARRRLGLEVAPVIDHVRPVSVNLEPGHRLGERRPVQQAALGALRGGDLQQAVLHRHDLA